MWKTAFVPFSDLFIDYIKSNNKNNMKVQHYHDTYEIYLQISGERYLFHDDICYTLTRGDLVIFKPFDIHYTQSGDSDYYERYVLNFHPERLSSFLTKSEISILFDKLNSCVIHLNNEQIQEIYNLLKNIDLYSKKKGLLSEKLVYSAVFQLIMSLSDMTFTANAVRKQSIQPEIINALQFINLNYAKNINLDMITEVTHLSKYHFCRIFHNATGATFYEYLSNIRLTKVHKLLMETDLSLTQIAQKTGFTSASHLSRVFKNVYNMSPREFRKDHAVK
jgi:AraC-like DNA-binding protein